MLKKEIRRECLQEVTAGFGIGHMLLGTGEGIGLGIGKGTEEDREMGFEVGREECTRALGIQGMIEAGLLLTFQDCPAGEARFERSFGLDDRYMLGLQVLEAELQFGHGMIEDGIGR